MNASDARNERAIEQVAGRASITHTLLESPKRPGRTRALILLDEADSLSGRATESARTVPMPPSLREFLRGRYGTIDALNDAWKLVRGAKPAPFDGWDHVPRSPGNFAWARLPTARKDLEEWRGAGRPRDVSDRGGLGAIARLVRSTRQPLVLTVNDERILLRYSAVFRTAVARVRFEPVRDREILALLESVAAREQFDLLPSALEAIVRRSQGDVRAALNDLDAVSLLPRGPLQLSALGTRDLGADFEALTEEALSSARYYRSVEVQDRLDATPDDLLPWIEENIPFFAPDPGHRSRAFDRLTSSERALARARRFRVWGLWSYASELMTGGVGLAIRDAPVPIERSAQFPRFLGDMGRSRTTRAVRDSVMRKAGRRLHLSRAKSRDSVLPFLEEIFRPERSRRGVAAASVEARRIARELELTPEEVAYLVDVEPDSAAVRRVLEPGPNESDPERDTGKAEAKEETGSSPASGGNETEMERKRVQRHLLDFGGR
jgi:DNA polymerase III delta prime subunit